MLESHPRLNNEGVDVSSAAVTSCVNTEPGCIRSSSWESAGRDNLPFYVEESALESTACSHPPLHWESAQRTQQI